VVGVATHTRTVASVFAQLVLLALIAAAFFVRTPEVAGPSMEPRIHSGEFVLINTLAYRFAHIERGQIVAFHRDSPTAETYLKRVIALPGERVSIANGVVSIDGKPLAETYVQFRDRGNVAPLVIPANSVFVLGDNRANSDDSRDFGALATSEISGRAILRIWPPTQLGAP